MKNNKEYWNNKLFWACCYGNISLVKESIANGADKITENNIFWAKQNNHKNIVEYLERYAKLTKINNQINKT